MFSKKSLLAVFFAMILCSCATVYKDQNFVHYQAKHETVAIVPFMVNAEESKRTPEDEGEAFQRSFYTQLLSRSQKGEYTVSFQDVSETNALLRRADISSDQLNKYTKAELAEVLKVDAVISGSIVRTSPQSTGSAVATAIIFGYSKTNEVNINLTIHDGEQGKLIWSFDHEISGGLGSSSEGMARSLIKEISKKFPYKK